MKPKKYSNKDDELLGIIFPIYCIDHMSITTNKISYNISTNKQEVRNNG